MRETTNLSNQVKFIVSILIFVSLACHLPLSDMWVDVNEKGDVYVEEDGKTSILVTVESESSDQPSDNGSDGIPIPVGTYIYEPFVDDKPPPGGDDWQYELESEFTVKVVNDGTVTGYKIYKIWVDDVSPNGCATHSEEGLTTVVSGSLEGNIGTVRLENRHWDIWEWHGDECGDGKEYRKDDEDVCEGEVTVSDTQMEISCQDKVIYTLIKE